MRILLYNWVPFNDPQRGGGVTTYLANLVEFLCHVDMPPELYFLCSGVYYDKEDRSLRIEKLPEDKDYGCKAYAVINSPVMAPAGINFNYIGNVYTDHGMKDIFTAFLRENGPFDVVHFHNLEGLTHSVLQCHSLFSAIRFIYTVHNYYAICPQVNLWKEERECCTMCDTGAECVSCMPVHVPQEKLLAKMDMTYSLVKDYSEEKATLYRKIGNQLDDQYRMEEKRKLKDCEKSNLAYALNRYRKTTIKVINENIDAVLAVSSRTAAIMIQNGLDRNKIYTSYIGTKVAAHIRTDTVEVRDGIVSIIYLGYQRSDKGFFFLIDALNKLSRDIAERIDLTIAAKANNRDAIPWCIDEQKFYGYHFFNGYQREDLEGLLFGKHLGIVPVLWEDNMPQVAMEMVSFGVPILCSDRGGTHELCSNREFCFHAGDTDDFILKLSSFVEEPHKIKKYYQSFQGLTTMHAHWLQLHELYVGK